jgi:hydrogenase expression/formation protein HypC
MCLAIPGVVKELYEDNGLLMGKVDFSGTVTNACLVYVPEAKVGQYVIVHAGFAISLLDEEEAQRTLDVWREYQAAGEREEAEQ